MDADIFDNTIWKVQEIAKPGKILATLNPKNPEVCWFRAINSDQNGHEFLAYKLGILLGLPMAKIRLRDDNVGETGVEAGSISFLVAPGAVDWSQFPFKDKFEEHFVFNKIINALTFDIWVSNTDRSAENFQYVKFQGDDAYHFFLIDHTECFKNPDNKNITDLVKIEDFRRLFKSNLNEFKLAIEKIQSLEQNTINREVDGIPEKFLSTTRKSEIKGLLELRSKNLDQMIEDFSNI